MGYSKFLERLLDDVGEAFVVREILATRRGGRNYEISGRKERTMEFADLKAERSESGVKFPTRLL